MFFARSILYFGLKLITWAVNYLQYPSLISIQDLNSKEVAQVLPDKETDLIQIQERIYNSYENGILKT